MDFFFQQGPHSSPLSSAALFDKRECVSHMSPELYFRWLQRKWGPLLRMRKARRGVSGLRTLPRTI